MSLNIFFTLCILGIDFMIYAFFQWTYGDKRRAVARKIAAIRNASPPPPRPFVISPQQPAPSPEPQIHRARATRHSQAYTSQHTRLQHL
jgi:hypothetical protein